MTDEIKEIKKEECFCKNKYFRNFLVVSLGTFVGGFCAISLFAALHKPPMPMMPMMYGMKPPCHHMMRGHHMKKHGFEHSHHKKMMKKHFENKVEFQKKIEEKKQGN